MICLHKELMERVRIMQRIDPTRAHAGRFGAVRLQNKSQTLDECTDFLVGAAYTPRSIAPETLRNASWSMVNRLFRCPIRCTPYLGIDGNAHVVADARCGEPGYLPIIGDLHPQEGNVNGTSLAALLSALDLVATNTVRAICSDTGALRSVGG